MGRSWYKSSSVIVLEVYYKSVVAQEEDLDELMLILLVIFLVLTILLILVGTGYNIRKWFVNRGKDFESESLSDIGVEYDLKQEKDYDYDEFEGIGENVEPQVHFSNQIAQNGNTEGGFYQQNLRPQTLGNGLCENIIKMRKQVLSTKSWPYCATKK